MSGGARCRPISVKPNLKIEADVAVYVTERSRTKFCVIIFYTYIALTVKHPAGYGPDVGTCI